MSKMFLGIPVLNRIDLLEQAIATHDYTTDLYVVNNNTLDAAFNERLKILQQNHGFDVYSARYNLGVAASWNRILMAALSRGYEYCYITANDVMMCPGAMKAFFELEKKVDEGVWMASDFNFFCVRCSDIGKIGWFDENFYPAYFEDNDFVYRVQLAGLKPVHCHTVPGIQVKHLGSQTIRSDAEFATHNSHTFGAWNSSHYRMKWGGAPNQETFKTPYNKADKDHRWWPDPGKTLEPRDWENTRRKLKTGTFAVTNDYPETPKEATTRSVSNELTKPYQAGPTQAKKIPASLEKVYKESFGSPDLSGLVSILMRYASGVNHITELGTSCGHSTAAFLRSLPKSVKTYDISRNPRIDEIAKAAEDAGIAFTFTLADDRTIDIEPTELLFIDTWHCYEQMKIELEKHADKASKWILMHDTETFGLVGEKAETGVWPAVAEFLRSHPEWELYDHRTHDNGLTVLKRVRAS